MMFLHQHVAQRHLHGRKLRFFCGYYLRRCVWLMPGPYRVTFGLLQRNSVGLTLLPLKMEGPQRNSPILSQKRVNAASGGGCE